MNNELAVALITVYLTLVTYFRKDLLKFCGYRLLRSLWDPVAFVIVMLIILMPYAALAGVYFISLILNIRSF